MSQDGQRATVSRDEHRAISAAEWLAKAEDMKARAAAVDWKGVDWSKLKASDIGVQFGTPMTEEQFLEYKKRQGQNVHVIKSSITKKT